MGGIQEGDTVAVFGCGPVGLAAARSAWLLGAGRVISVDLVDARLRLARAWAGAETIDLRTVEDVVAALKDVTRGRGPDVCVEAVGLEATGSAFQTLAGRKLKLMAGSAVALAWAIQSVRKGGTLSIVGVYGPPANLVPLGVAMNKGLTFRMGQASVKRYMPHLLEHVRAGRLDPRGLITHRLPLAHAEKAYRIFDRKEDGCVKAVLLPHAPPAPPGPPSARA
jgi:threonine dehydrogenase-like Zn-dependent dehydrogenase